MDTEVTTTQNGSPGPVRPFLANATGFGVLEGNNQRPGNLPRLGSQVFVGNDSGGNGGITFRGERLMLDFS